MTEEARGPLWAQDRLEVGSERVLEGSAYCRHVEGRLWLCCSWLAVLP